MRERVLIVVHGERSNPGRVGRQLRELGYELDIRQPSGGAELPRTMDEHVAAIVFGGPMSANDGDKLDFIRTELDWIPTTLDSGKPFLGICLGAQMLAKVLGAKVEPHPARLAEIGYYPVRPVEAGTPLFDREALFYQWHREGFHLPSGATLLATADAFENQAFQYGDSAFGLQFHPEVTGEDNAHLDAACVPSPVIAERTIPRRAVPAPACQRAVCARLAAPLSHGLAEESRLGEAASGRPSLADRRSGSGRSGDGLAAPHHSRRSSRSTPASAKASISAVL